MAQSERETTWEIVLEIQLPMTTDQDTFGWTQEPQSGPTRDWSDVDIVSTADTHHWTQERNPSSAAVTSEAEGQTYSVQGIKREPMDQDMTWDRCNQFQPEERMEDNVTMKLEPCDDLSSESVDVWNAVDSSYTATVPGIDTSKVKVEPSTDDVGLDKECTNRLFKSEPVTTGSSTDVIKTEPVTTSIDSDGMRYDEPVTTNTVTPESITCGQKGKETQTGEKQDYNKLSFVTLQSPASSQTPFTRDLHSKTFTQASDLKAQEVVHFSPRLFTCQTGGNAFTQESSLNNRKKLHTGQTQRPYICDVCNKAFTSAASLEEHKKIHTGQKPLVCDVCNKTFTQTHQLKRHKLIHTRYLACDLCDKTFSSSWYLKQHKVFHTSKRLFACDACGKTFIHAGHLKQHKLIHTGQRDFVCDTCGKTFIQTSHLSQHKLIHTGVRKFACDICDKTFTLAGNLKQHKLIHTGQRHFACDTCGKTFIQASHLKQHKLIHTGQRDFVCDTCGKTFIQTTHLRQHKLIHTGVR